MKVIVDRALSLSSNPRSYFCLWTLSLKNVPTFLDISDNVITPETVQNVPGTNLLSGLRPKYPRIHIKINQ
jgi:hypothetical protein